MAPAIATFIVYIAFVLGIHGNSPYSSQDCYELSLVCGAYQYRLFSRADAYCFRQNSGLPF